MNCTRFQVLPIHFAVDVESRLFTNNEPGNQVTISNSGYVPAANSYHTAISSSFKAWPNWSSYSFITKCLRRILKTDNATHDSLSAFTFVGCVGPEYCAVERCIVPTSTLAITNALFHLGCIVPNQVLADNRVGFMWNSALNAYCHNSLFLPYHSSKITFSLCR